MRMRTKVLPNDIRANTVVMTFRNMGGEVDPSS